MDKNSVFYRVIAAGITGAAIATCTESLNPTHPYEKKIRNVVIASLVTAATTAVLEAKYRK